MNTIPLVTSTSKSVKKTQTRPTTAAGKEADLSSASRLLLLQNMVPVAMNLISSQLDAFSSRLADELGKLSEQTVRPDEAKLCLEAHLLVKRNGTAFYRLVSGQINAALTKEVSVFNTKKRVRKEDATMDGTAQTYWQMEEKILLRHVCQSLELASTESLTLLNTLIGRLLNRMPIDISQNPFRPEIFVRAIHQAWKELDATGESHLIVLRLLQPSLFLQLTPVFEEINQTLIERGINPDAEISSEENSGTHVFLPSQKAFNQDPYLREKLLKIFDGKLELAPSKRRAENRVAGVATYSDPENDFSRDLKKQTEQSGAGFDAARVDRQFFEELMEMQKTYVAPDIHNTRFDSILRPLLNTASAESLTVVERNTIELLARIFDYIFAMPTLFSSMKSLIAQLQFPILRVALQDKEFFFRESHPARTFMNIVGSTGLILDAELDKSDPLLGMIGEVIERVQSEFDQQLELFSDVVADLENFMRDEEQKTQAAISEPVQTALTEEKMRVARELAEHDVEIRVETGEVAGFLEVFLQEQWIRILTLAHSVKDEKPRALENALKTMDDLIWSLKPKNSAQERKELISKLPAMLSLLNAWLNAIRWDEPDRVLFFSKLAERHALMARAPLELSPRRQLEIAVNIAQRASNRRLDRFVNSQMTQVDDEAIKQVESLELGMWLDFTNEAHISSRYRLAWISPKRSRFIFTNRQGLESQTVSAADLAQRWRAGSVTTILTDSLIDRALTVALRNVMT